MSDTIGAKKYKIYIYKDGSYKMMKPYIKNISNNYNQYNSYIYNIQTLISLLTNASEYLYTSDNVQLFTLN